MTDQVKSPKTFRSGFVSIIGRPNVGKSTLLNHILGERIAITTYKPQTTRNRILGVYHFDDGQIVYLDTPGIHRAKAGLNKFMLDTAMSSISDGDVVYLMVEAGPKFIDRPDLGEGNRLIIEAIEEAKKTCFLVINKIDLVDREKLLPFIDRVKELGCFEEIFPISAIKDDGIEQLINATVAKMPEGPPYYPDDTITDRTYRFLASEIIREQTLLQLREEVPYSIGVKIEQFKELDAGNRFHIEALIYVERDSQKGIVLGKGGQTIRKIGEAARVEMEKNFEVPVGLKLLVRLKKEWTTNAAFLDELGYSKDKG